jgi:glutaryl-CoA dehydrogenase
MPAMTTSPSELFAIDSLLTEEERSIRDVVRTFVDREIKPNISGWFGTGELPARELARQLGDLGVLGMHLEGYGCAGTNAVSYGLACLELEAGDSGIRSLVSVQGSLAMYAIHAFGSEEQRQQWLPGMARGELIGCFGLTEPDFGSNPSGMLTNARRDGSDLDPERHQDVDHQWQRRRCRGGVGTNRRRDPRVRGAHRHAWAAGKSDPGQDVAAGIGDLGARVD